jgi:predicted alpha/beta-fold hydrolase
MNAIPFKPPFYLRNAMLQTFLGSKRPGFFRSKSMLAAARPMTMTTEEGIRLGGSFSSSAANTRGLVILLHGWEGSMSSAYVKVTGQYLFDLGFDIFRLNFRDHGGTHHLNEGLFYATLLDEVFSAVIQATRLSHSAPAYLCGFSLGGNFALRIAAKISQQPRDDSPIAQVFAISPVLNPSKATDAIDRNPSIRRYFLTKWQRSLKIKQHLFPQHYDFSDILKLTNIRLMTQRLLERYSSYSSADEYFAGYAFDGRDLQKIQIPTILITAEDDPVIPVADFYKLPPNPCVRRIIHPNGGHNGFLQNIQGSTWYEEFMRRAFSASQPSDGERN